MKLKNFLAAAGLALIGLGSLLAVASAEAAVVACSNINTSSATWPAGSYSQKCGTVNATKANSIYAALAGLSSTESNLYALAATPVYYFKNKADYTDSYPTVLQPIFGGSAEAFADDLPAFTVKGATSGTPRYTIVFEEITVGGAPFAISTNGLKVNAVHEIGHSSDYYYRATAQSISGKEASDGRPFLNLLSRDWANFNLLAPCNASGTGVFNGFKGQGGVFFCNGVNGAGSALSATYTGLTNRTILQRGIPGIFLKPREVWSELHAIVAGQSDTGFTDSADQYFSGTRFACTHKFVETITTTGMMPTAAQLPSGCLPPVCDEQGITLNNYPLDGNNVAGATHAYRCRNPNTGVKPSDTRTNELFVSSLQNMPANVKTKLKAENVKFYFFNNRDEANDYWNSTQPGFTNAISLTLPCGNTARNSSTGAIVVSIYDNCDYTQNTSPVSYVQNPNLRRTSFHEAGKAFGIALAPTDPTYQKAGFVTLFTSDKTALTPPNWSAASGGNPAMTQAQRYSYVCNMFSISALSALEKEYGAITAGAANGAVCDTVSTPNIFYQPIAKTPTVIAGDKLPLFMTSSMELWAEVFVVVIDSATSPSSYLPMNDRVIGLNQSPTRSFNCTRGVVQAYVNTLLPPPATGAAGTGSLQSLGCNQTPGPL